MRRIFLRILCYESRTCTHALVLLFPGIYRSFGYAIRRIYDSIRYRKRQPSRSDPDPYFCTWYVLLYSSRLYPDENDKKPFQRDQGEERGEAYRA